MGDVCVFIRGIWLWPAEPCQESQRFPSQREADIGGFLPPLGAWNEQHEGRPTHALGLTAPSPRGQHQCLLLIYCVSSRAPTCAYVPAREAHRHGRAGSPAPARNPQPSGGILTETRIAPAPAEAGLATGVKGQRRKESPGEHAFQLEGQGPGCVDRALPPKPPRPSHVPKADTGLGVKSSASRTVREVLGLSTHSASRTAHQAFYHQPAFRLGDVEAQGKGQWRKDAASEQRPRGFGPRPARLPASLGGGDAPGPSDRARPATPGSAGGPSASPASPARGARPPTPPPPLPAAPNALAGARFTLGAPPGRAGGARGAGGAGWGCAAADDHFGGRGAILISFPALPQPLSFGKGKERNPPCVWAPLRSGVRRGIESKTAGRTWRGDLAQGRPAGRPWANQPQMKTRRAEAVVSARRRRRALEAAPKTFEIWIPGAQTARPAGAPRPSLCGGVAWVSPGWPGWGGCPDVGRGWARGRRRTLPVALLRLRPPRAATPRQGPAGAGVAPGMPRTCRGATTWRRAGPVAPPARPARPSHLAPSFSPEQPAAEGRRGVRGFAARMKGDLSRGTQGRNPSWLEGGSAKCADRRPFSGLPQGARDIPGRRQGPQLKALGIPSLGSIRLWFPQRDSVFASSMQPIGASPVLSSSPHPLAGNQRKDPLYWPARATLLPSSATRPARLLRKVADRAPGAAAWPPRSGEESWVCASSLLESSHCRPSPSLVPPEATPHSQNRSKGGATLVVAGSGRRRNRNGHRGGSCEVAVERWSQRACPQTPDCLQASTGFPGEREPRACFGGSLRPLGPPQVSRGPARSPPSFLGRVSGREPRPGWLFARPPRAFHSRSAFALFLSPWTLSQGIAQASCSRSFRGQERGAQTRPRASAPCPSCTLSGSPPPSPRPQRARGPAGGALGRRRGAQQLPQPDAGAAHRTRRLAAGATAFSGSLRSLDVPLLSLNLSALATPAFDAVSPPSPLGPPGRSGHALCPLCSRPLSFSLAAGLGLAWVLLERRQPGPAPPRRVPGATWEPAGTWGKLGLGARFRRGPRAAHTEKERRRGRPRRRAAGEGSPPRPSRRCQAPHPPRAPPADTPLPPGPAPSLSRARGSLPLHLPGALLLRPPSRVLPSPPAAQARGLR
ncbi:nascent polypeptide-associated complex subunit alpha, muscle-specific form-like [Meles meles]|uniref:nascent polypeptide-associated complex subunit alpha, muscle-specific form-like n=1 Tax=Meles meles TaxID=9662 RepID=UPI001E69A587|nr:nascent polypeptide-associated complex subunit alpha, muscle-specific form-like [Meles meles]